MKIAIANSRTDKKLKNKEMSWEEFTKRCSSTIRTTETVEEYRKMNKGDKANIKDRGGFVAGELKEGRRKNGMVRCRSALTLDMDYAEPGIQNFLFHRQPIALMKMKRKCSASIVPS